MTVSSTTNKVSYTAAGSQTVFAYTFKIYVDADLKVYVNGILKTLTTDYTVSDAGVSSGGNVTFGTGLTASDVVVVERVLTLTQGTDYVENDPFPAETHEAALDRLTFISQQHQDALDRSIKFATTVTDAGDVEVLDSAASRANKLFAFDASGDLDATQEIGVYKNNWSTTTVYVARDIVKDTGNNNIYFCNTAHTSSGALPVSSNTDSAKWDLIVDAASATTSASAAAASAVDAQSSEDDATTAQTAAESAKSAAETAQSAAETAQTASELALDTFDDRYLGAKATDPTLDNDGNALIDGAMFFDTTLNITKAYDLASTTWLRTTPTSVEQGHINTLGAISANITTVAGISANTTTVAGISANVTTVAGNTTNINTVAGNDADITTVATNIAKVTTVADDIVKVIAVADDLAEAVSEVVTVADDLNEAVSEIDTVAVNITNVNTVGANIANVNAVATNATNINSVVSNSTNVNTVAASIGDVNSYANQYRIAASAPTTSLDAGDLWWNTTNSELRAYDGNGSVWQATAPSSADQVSINIVAGDVVYVEDLGAITDAADASTGNGDITTVATDIANVNTAATNIANVNIVAGVSAAVSTVAGISSSVSTVATNFTNVNRYASEYSISATAPNSPVEGWLWYDSTANTLKYYTGTIWASISAGISDVVSDATPELGGDLDGLNNNITNIGTVNGTNLQIDFGGLS